MLFKKVKSFVTAVAFKKAGVSFFSVSFFFVVSFFFDVVAFKLVVIGSLRVRALLLLSVSILFLHSQPLPLG